MNDLWGFWTGFCREREREREEEREGFVYFKPCKFEKQTTSDFLSEPSC